MGSYTVSAKRSELQPGQTVFANVVVGFQNGASFLVPVTIRRQGDETGGWAGSLVPIDIQVINADDSNPQSVARGSVVQPEGGVYRYSMPLVPGTPRIMILARSDTDNDGLICNTGEARGAYPVLGSQAEILEPRGNPTGIDFSVAPFGGVAPQTLSELARAPNGRRYTGVAPIGKRLP